MIADIRAFARARTDELGHADLAEEVELVVSELVSNAYFHGGGCTGVRIVDIGEGVRVEVTDASALPPLIGHASDQSLTGRGLRLVAALSSKWGADPTPDGKVVWAEITGAGSTSFEDATADELLAAWSDDDDEDERVLVELGEVPTSLLLAAKSHVDNLVREFALLTTAELQPRLLELLRIVENFSDARLAIKRQALAASRRGEPTTRLTLHLPRDAADAAEAYLAALDELDSYGRAGRLLTLETPPQHRVFRRWYIGELVRQLRVQGDADAVRPMTSFQTRLLEEVDRVAAAQRVAERTSRLYAVASALASAATPEAVANAVLVEGVAALGAIGGGVLLTTDHDRLVLPGAVGYDDTVVERLRSELRDAELPAALALRTGEPVWLESRAERDRRFPELVGLERGTLSLCAVPLEVQGRRLGAVRFSFGSERLFDEDERNFVRALAALAAQALDRAQLQRDRIESSRELQRSLLPPSLPDVEGLDIAAIYHPFGDGVEVGGDFYDIWELDEHAYGIAIGDAAGTGLSAAALTALVRHTLRALTTAHSDPAMVLRRLNQAMRQAAHETATTEQFCTAIAGTLRIADGRVRLELAAGGHPPVLVRRADGSVEELLIGGMPLGLFADAAPVATTIELLPGETALLYTDGVIEARRDDELFGTERVAGVLSSTSGKANDVVLELEAAVLRHTGQVLSDDLAAVALYVPPRTQEWGGHHFRDTG